MAGAWQRKHEARAKGSGRGWQGRADVGLQGEQKERQRLLRHTACAQVCGLSRAGRPGAAPSCTACLTCRAPPLLLRPGPRSRSSAAHVWGCAARSRPSQTKQGRTSWPDRARAHKLASGGSGVRTTRRCLCMRRQRETQMGRRRHTRRRDARGMKCTAAHEAVLDTAGLRGSFG